MRLTSFVFTCAATVAISGQVAAQPSPLSPEGYAEFNRIYGATAGRKDPTAAKQDEALRTSIKLPGRATSLTLQKFTPREFVSTLSTRAQIAQALTATSTPASVNSLAQLAILAPNGNMEELTANDYLRFWHKVALDATSVDHIPSVTRPIVYYQQIGPHRSSRAMALVHLAMFEAANIYSGAYQSIIYGVGPDSFIESPVAGSPSNKKVAAAIHQAAYDVLAWLYPGLIASRIAPGPLNCRDLANAPLGEFDFNLQEYRRCAAELLDTGSADYQEGARAGHAVAQRLISLRENDGSQLSEPAFGAGETPRLNRVEGKFPAGQWSPDPVSKIQTALGAYWHYVRPFALTNAAAVRPAELEKAVLDTLGRTDLPLADALATIPSLKAVYEWAAEPLYDTKGKREIPTQNKDGRSIAQFWAYDGTAGLCAPPRLYNQIVDAVIESSQMQPANNFTPMRLRQNIQLKEAVEVARFYALVNIAMADAAIAAWEAKYHYQIARPVTVIRQAQLNSPAAGFPTQWFPLGAQVSNSDGGLNITPPFPAYPSGHASFGGALFGVLRQFYEPVGQFKFLSDEFNGLNKDALNYVRCARDANNMLIDPFTSPQFCDPRPLTMACAERENADSRLTMGVHYIFDADAGILLGNKVAREVVSKVLKPKAGAMPTGTVFSAFAADGRQDRDQTSLVCGDVKWPGKLNDPADPKVGFGSFDAVAVNP
ncbi:phosphatase PAP2 family protein [Bradyrhizobium sp. 38]|uniref:vanadium-dependent haloperoxidase n=1 Tax=unclassified Bradyrhizobium TaxID=2631580 RepID=UPI001FFA0DF0|nr:MULTISPECIES: vanadium-dependent haloperoxidase [unclassified Bradyrhizobium]MCK1339747.1 phosphatase PAP2 family protein [Bradyrhizobium sp. 38]MCK1777966.1 phosphatase PAP2 family protein [Bradyrhizobium sp. 132]